MYGGGVIGGGSVRGPEGADWEVAGSGDYDGDGRADILLRNRTLRYLGYWSMNGAEILTVTDLPEDLGSDWEVVDTGDYDGDGRADILWRGGAAAAIDVWLMKAPAEVDHVILSDGTSSRWEVAGSGDLDGNGQDDIVWRSRSSYALGSWLLGADLHINDVGFYVTSPGFGRRGITRADLVACGDFDGDGRTDLVAQDLRGKRLGIWLMNGLDIKQSIALDELAAGWHLAGAKDEHSSDSR
jgi:hypothetical protein